MVKLSRRVIVGTTPTKLIDSDPKRTSLAFANLDTVRFFIEASQDVSLTQGFPIEGNGNTGSFTDFFGDDPTLAYFGISAAGGADVRILVGKSALLALLRKIILFFLPRE